ncbi:MAG: c-type cytochrome [Flavipsychrobacter sp.]|nr:c-type cytochrome [Flavipsychrobacter sp.]
MRPVLAKALIITGMVTAMAVAQTSAYFKDDNKGVTTRNLRELPKNISHDELIAIMRSFNTALGVKCGYCHVEQPGQLTPEGQPAMNFASDDKITKRIARRMMRMTKDINEKLDDMGDKEFENIQCATCHRGHQHPSAGLDSIFRRPAGAPSRK